MFYDTKLSLALREARLCFTSSLEECTLVLSAHSTSASYVASGSARRVRVMASGALHSQLLQVAVEVVRRLLQVARVAACNESSSVSNVFTERRWCSCYTTAAGYVMKKNMIMLGALVAR